MSKWRNVLYIAPEWDATLGKTGLVLNYRIGKLCEAMAGRLECMAPIPDYPLNGVKEMLTVALQGLAKQANVTATDELLTKLNITFDTLYQWGDKKLPGSGGVKLCLVDRTTKPVPPGAMIRKSKLILVH